MEIFLLIIGSFGAGYYASKLVFLQKLKCHVRILEGRGEDVSDIIDFLQKETQ